MQWWPPAYLIRPQDNDAFTRLTRNNSGDDWLKRGIRSDAADLYRQQDLNVTLEHDFWGSSGTGGYSDLKAHTTMLHVDAPLADGRMFFRTDLVNMDAGSFSTNSDGSYSPNWGTCGEIACTSGSKNQTDGGASVAVGWKNETWSADIGTTPMGFNVVDVVGGLSYSNDLDRSATPSICIVGRFPARCSPLADRKTAAAIPG